jgi:hypothetical protein
MPYRTIIPLLLLGTALLPEAATAQYTLPQPRTGSVLMEPYAGAYFDNAGRSEISFDRGGPLAGLRVGVAALPGIRLLGDVGYAPVRRAAVGTGEAGSVARDTRNFLVSAGAEWEVVPGDISGTLGLQAGRVWRSLGEQEGVPGGYASHSVLVPAVAVRAALTSRTDLKLSLQSYARIDDLASQSPALSVGLAFR